MRKSDREIKEFEEIRALVESCDTLRIGYNDEAAPYIVPLSFGFETEGESFVFYIHGANVGRRHTLAEKSPDVCVELDLCRGFTDTLTCDYRSFIGTGVIERVSGTEAVHGLELLCCHCGYESMTCSQEMIDSTCVEKITVREYTAKQRFKR